MTLEEYLEHLDALNLWCKENMPAHYYSGICDPWFTRIAPIKARQYGTECWERLGEKGLIVDLSACWYRVRNLPEEPKTADDQLALWNALIDIFGYSMIYCVCANHRPSSRKNKLFDENWNFRPSSEILDFLIGNAWYKNESWPMMAVALAVSTWKERSWITPPERLTTFAPTKDVL
jgi:hypothetical protein